MRADPEALAAHGPAIAEIGIVVDVRLIEIDQETTVVLGTDQQILHLRKERRPSLRISPAEQLAGLLPRQLQAVQGAADRLAAAAVAKCLLHPADQASQGPARCRISAG